MNAFYRVSQLLGLDTKDAVYERFKNESGNFDTIKLATYGLLINRRITETKAEVLWHLYDLNCDGFLQRQEAFMMVNEVAHLAV
jgi:hypothetical protein